MFSHFVSPTTIFIPRDVRTNEFERRTPAGIFVPGTFFREALASSIAFSEFTLPRVEFFIYLAFISWTKDSMSEGEW